MEQFVKTRSVARPTQLAIFISILAIAARLILIDQPYIDNWSWRQSDVAAIARNYLQSGFHFAHPQIDWAGDGPGFVGTEFPILPFLAAICYKFFGVHEWIGRIQGVILFAASLLFFFLLVRDTWHGLPAHGPSTGYRRRFAETAASWALFFYSFAPLNLFTSREFMPDVPSLSLALIGLYFFLRYCHAIRDSRIAWSPAGELMPYRANGESVAGRWLIASAGFISLALLIKLPTAIIGAPLLYLAVAAVHDRPTSSDLSNGGRRPALQNLMVRLAARWELWFFALITLAPPAIWYWHAHEIAEKFYPHHFFGAGGIRIMSASWYWKIAKQITTSSLTPVLFALATAGAFMTRSTTEPAGAERRGREGPRGLMSREASQSTRAGLFHFWLAAMIIFIVVVGYGNRHQWYQLPLVPIAAALAGAACASMASKISARSVRITLSILLAGSFSILAFHYVRPFYQPSAVQLRDLGLELRRTTPGNSLIVAADNGDPTIFYYAERKGWHFLEKNGIYDGNPGDNQQLIVDLEQLRGRGATHLVFISSTFWWLDYYHEFAEHLAQRTTPLEATPEFRIYKLNLARE
ncbi:MAG: hypothetical protein DMF30_04790 [Verrucomicrobia bacterium]|nr:MAG: hypothetical protein DMF30_04790 [Verrucomicrobiota bacterium]